VQDRSTGLCFRHASLARKTALHDSVDLSEEIFASKDEAPYDTTQSINAILSNVIELVAAGRISTRRAAVITYALSLMLRTAVIAERQAWSRLSLNPDFGRSSWNGTEGQEPAAAEKSSVSAANLPEQETAGVAR